MCKIMFQNKSKHMLLIPPLAKNQFGGKRRSFINAVWFQTAFVYKRRFVYKNGTHFRVLLALAGARPLELMTPARVLNYISK